MAGKPIGEIAATEYLTARIDPTVAKTLRSLAQERGVKAGTIAREILTDYAKKAKSP